MGFGPDYYLPISTCNSYKWNLYNSISSTKFVFFEPIGKQRWPPWPRPTFTLQPLNGIWRIWRIWRIGGGNFSLYCKFIFSVQFFQCLRAGFHILPSVLLVGMLYQQIVGIHIGTNCAHLIVGLLLYCYERDFISILHKSKRNDLIDMYYDTSRYIDDIFIIVHPEGERTVTLNALKICTENINLQYKNNFH